MEFLWQVCPFWSQVVTFWVSFSYFFRIWASLRWWREARVWTKCKKEERQSKKESRNETLLIRNLCFVQLFFHRFLDESWEVFFLALVAEVSQMRATLKHFSNHIAATLESWKLCFVYTKHYFSQFLRAGLGCFGQLFANFFPRWNWTRYFTICWQIEGPAVPPKATFVKHFRYTFYIDFLWIFNGKPDSESGKGWGRLPCLWGPKPLIYWPLKADIRSEASWKMNADKQKKT